MTKFEREIQQTLNDNKDGSFSTQQSRKENLECVAKDLNEMGYNQMSINSLKEKHIVKLVEKWLDNGKSVGTIKNRMSNIRWLSRKANIAHRIPNNQGLKIPNRINVTNQSKATELKQSHLDKIPNTYVKYSLQLQEKFGFRREEAIKINVQSSDKGDKLVLKASTTKGGRSREIPISTKEQRQLLNEIKSKIGDNSLIPSDKRYVDQKNIYKNSVAKSGLGKAHGLRHKYAQDRYKELTGKDCPTCGGKRQKDMSKEERDIDRKARLQISAELGHCREQITSIYLGS